MRLRTLPVVSPEQLVEVRHPTGTTHRIVPRPSSAVYLRAVGIVQQHQQAFSGVLAWSTRRFNIASGGEVRYVEGLWVSSDFFPVLGVRPLLGRLLTPADDVLGCGAPGAVLSHAFWQRQFGGNPNVLGQRIPLDGVPFDIIGVTPPTFWP